MSRVFGHISQLGYVVSDVERSIDGWVRNGVGPWFYFEHVQFDYFRYRGADSPPDQLSARPCWLEAQRLHATLKVPHRRTLRV